MHNICTFTTELLRLVESSDESNQVWVSVLFLRKIVDSAFFVILQEHSIILCSLQELIGRLGVKSSG